MAEVINLRKKRKTKARLDADAQAALNRAAFGRTKASKRAELSEREAADHRLDGHARQRPNDD